MTTPRPLNPDALRPLYQSAADVVLRESRGTYYLTFVNVGGGEFWSIVISDPLGIEAAQEWDTRRCAALALAEKGDAS